MDRAAVASVLLGLGGVALGLVAAAGQVAVVVGAVGLGLGLHARAHPRGLGAAGVVLGATAVALGVLHLLAARPETLYH